MSTDKDYYQLVSERVFILNTAMKGDRRILQAQDIAQRYGVTPTQWCDFRALTGDPADNISGVPGVGPRTAARLLANGVCLEQLLSQADITPKIRTTLQIHGEKLFRDRQLIQMRTYPDLLLNTTGEPITRWSTPAQILESLQLWS